MQNNKPCVLVFSHSGGFSGAERSLVETMELLANDYTLHLVMPTRGPLFDRMVESDAPPLKGLHVVRFYFDYARDGIPLWRKIYWRLMNVVANARLIRIAKKILPVLIYSNSVASWQGSYCAEALSLPHVWHLRELILDNAIGAPFQGYNIQSKKFSNPKTAFLANSHYVAKWYEDNHNITSVRVVYQPVVISCDRATDFSNKINLICIGGLHAQKRHFIAIMAVSLLPKKMLQRITLRIFGLGPERENLEELILKHGLKEHVSLMGFSDNAVNEIASADALLTTSVGEAFGRVTAEALLLGCPVIGVASGGTAELLGESSRGKLIPPDDPDALASAIIDLVSNRGVAHDRAIAGKEWAQKNLTDKSYYEGVSLSIRSLMRAPQ